MTNRLLFVVTAVGLLMAVSVTPAVVQPFTFSGVKFPEPISASMIALGLTTPTPIQKSAITPLTSGLSAVLHAETGIHVISNVGSAVFFSTRIAIPF